MIWYISNNELHVHFNNGDSFTACSTDEPYDALVEHAKNYDEEELRLWYDANNKIVENINNLVISNGNVYFNGIQMDSLIARHISHLHNIGSDSAKIEKFLLNMMSNPYIDAVHEIYEFINSCYLPITDDGCFLAYKYVDSNYKDCHTGKIDNSIGSKVGMKPEDCDMNRTVTCSTGLHFCSYNYLPIGGSYKYVVVKVNPKDVTSIPVDYNNTKGRCCYYEVIDELRMGEKFEDVERYKQKDEIVKEKPAKQYSSRVEEAYIRVIVDKEDIKSVADDMGIYVNSIRRYIHLHRQREGI